MDTVKDVIEITKNYVTDDENVEIYFSISGKSNYHTDNLKHVDIDESILYEEVLDYLVMDGDTYMENVWANTSYTKNDFNEVFGEDAKVLVILIKY